MIVVAEKQTVYEKFPTPLINRLEKHLLTVNTMLNDDQRHLADELQKWATEFSIGTCAINQRYALDTLAVIKRNTIIKNN